MIAAVVLAAGLSTRMGNPKMCLPWGDTTVIGQVVSVLLHSGVSEVLVVTGGHEQQVWASLKDLPVHIVHNPRYAEDQMSFSLQIGLANLPAAVEAALVTLGDQPQVQVEVVKALIQAFTTTRLPLIVPSFQGRRGHPWLIARPLWEEVFRLDQEHTLRDMLRSHADQIFYLPVTGDSILRDLDTPEEYLRQRPP